MRLNFKPRGFLSATASLAVSPFQLASASGTAGGFPLLAVGLGLDREITVAASVDVDPRTFMPTGGRVDAPLSGISLKELRVLFKPAAPAAPAETPATKPEEPK